MKNIKTMLTVVLVLTSSLTACSNHSGNVRATDQTIIQKIKVGKTSKDDVVSLLGNTTNIMREATGKDTWIYQYSQTDLGARAFIPFVNLMGESPVNTKLSTLTIEFNQDGIVDSVLGNTK